MANEVRGHRILFVVNGLGMGNSTRCYSVIQHLSRTGHKIDVATSKNGLLFFKNRSEVENLYPIDSIDYEKNKNEKLDTFLTFLNAITSLHLFLKNGLFLTRLIRNKAPTIVVYDSQYNLIPMLFTKAKFIALNNADRVVTQFFLLRKKPLSIFPQFLGIEFWDFVFHKLFSDYVVSPWIETLGKGNGKRVHRVGLIVRDEIAPGDTKSEAPERILIMLSGSSFGVTLDPSKWKLPYHFDVVGRIGTSSEKVTFYGKIVDNLEILKRADILIINGGFSAVSEAIALRKPTIVIPVENHAEQYVNAKLVEGLGMGLMANNENIREKLEVLIEGFTSFLDKAKNHRVEIKGACDCAHLIQGKLNIEESSTLNLVTVQKTFEGRAS